jgi:hypothetical protein
MGLCLPLAVLLGYFLAEPMDSGSLAVVIMVLAVLAVPLLMKWHHPLLVFSWNAFVTPVMLPGRPALWMLLAGIAFLFACLNRAVNPAARFLNVPSVTLPLVLMALIVIVTAKMTGGIGLRIFGSEHYGGKKYVFILAAIIGYFALTSRRIPVERAGLYVGLFFLSGITAIVANMVFSAGPKFYFLLDFFTPDGALEQATYQNSLYPTITRIAGLCYVGTAIFSYLLARYGLRGSLDITKPWRLILMLFALVAALLGGFRSVAIMFVLTFAVLFYLEGLHRTRWLAGLIGLVVLGCVTLFPFSDKLPLVAQRTLSFLPIKLDPIARQSAEASNEWRLTMWTHALPDVPKYFFHGKGYSIDPNEMYLEFGSAALGFAASTAGSMVAGDFHNGPLSVLIPFGVYGAIAFVWFLIVGFKVLHRNFQFGDPRLKSYNALILSAFVARVIFFFIFFGSLYSDLAIFTGLLGMGISLNGTEVASTSAEPEVSDFELNTEYNSSRPGIDLVSNV